MTSSSPQKPNIDDTFAEDDFFDLDKYKKAAQVAFDFSIGKKQEDGRQTRENIEKTGFEQRQTNQQSQDFRDRDEARDSRQSQKAYRF